MAFKLKKRCKFCAHPLRDDGTCQNPKCVNYTEEEQNENKETTKANGGES
jgi:hypothetical protein